MSMDLTLSIVIPAQNLDAAVAALGDLGATFPPAKKRKKNEADGGRGIRRLLVRNERKKVKLEKKYNFVIKINFTVDLFQNLLVPNLH